MMVIVNAGKVIDRRLEPIAMAACPYTKFESRSDTSMP
jgi:hypothetical protein